MPPSMWSGFATSRAAAAINGGGSDRRQAAPRFLSFFCARLSCRAATRSITLLRAGLGGGAWRSPSRCALGVDLPVSPHHFRLAQSRSDGSRGTELSGKGNPPKAGWFPQS
jgi:hypothetical protein